MVKDRMLFLLKLGRRQRYSFSLLLFNIVLEVLDLANKVAKVTWRKPSIMLRWRLQPQLQWNLGIWELSLNFPRGTWVREGTLINNRLHVVKQDEDSDYC